MKWFWVKKERCSRRIGRYTVKRCLVFVVVIAVGYNLLINEYLNDTSNTKNNFTKIFPERHVSQREIKRILFWTKNYGSITWQTYEYYSISDAFKGCVVSKCIVTADKALASESDALLFHPADIISTFSLPPVRSPEQIYIYASLEPPPYQFLVNLRKYSNYFNWTFGYRSDMDILMPYAHWKTLPSVNKSVEQIDFSKHKIHKVAWAVGNCYPYFPRQLIAQELSKYIEVDVFGHCGKSNPKCSDRLCPEVLGKYKFYLSFENSLCKDYVTEKFWNALIREQIPIVRGGADYTKIAPPNSFINVLDFPNVAKLAEYLHYLDKNHTAYNEYLKWRSHFAIGYTNWRCELCKALHDTSRPAQVYADLYGWMSEENCPLWSNSLPWKEEDPGGSATTCSNKDISEINDDDADNIDLVFKDMEFLFNEEFEEESSLVEADIDNKDTQVINNTDIIHALNEILKFNMMDEKRILHLKSRVSNIKDEVAFLNSYKSINKQDSWRKYHLGLSIIEDKTNSFIPKLILPFFTSKVFSFFLNRIIISTEANLISQSTLDQKDYEIIAYIGGWIINKLFSRYVQAEKKEYVHMLACNVDGGKAAFIKLTKLKDRGGLKYINGHFVKLLIRLEKNFVGIFTPFSTKVCKDEFIKKCTFECKQDFLNCFDIPIIDDKIQNVILIDIVKLFFNIRIHHRCKIIIEKLQLKKSKGLRKTLKKL